MLSYFVRLANTGVAGARQEVFHARLSFVAESIEVKAAILHSCSPSHCFSRVEDVDASHPADILVASPPCLLYSKANRHSTYADQMAEATRVIGELRRILGLLRPRLLILEQTSSLVTHCPAAYQLYLGMCQDLPFIVLSYVVDAPRSRWVSPPRTLDSTGLGDLKPSSLSSLLLLSALV